MITGTPLEDELIRFDVKLLEDTVPDEAVLDATFGEVPGCTDVGCDQSCVLWCDGELVVVSI